MGADIPLTQQQVAALAGRLDDKFFGYIFDAVMEEGYRSGIGPGKGRRNQTFKRGMVCVALLDTFGCQDSFVAKALKKNRTSISDRANEVRELMISDRFGFGVSEMLTMAAKMEEWRDAVIAGSERPVDKSLSGWNASIAGWACYVASEIMAFRYPVQAAEYVNTVDHDKIREFEVDVKKHARTLDERRDRAKVSREITAPAMAIANQKRIAELLPPPPLNGHKCASIKPSHPAVAALEKNVNRLQELNPIRFYDAEPQGDYMTAIWMEPDLLKGGDAKQLKITTTLDKAVLASALPKLVTVLAAGGFRPSVKLEPHPRANKRGEVYALVTVRA